MLPLHRDIPLTGNLRDLLIHKIQNNNGQMDPLLCSTNNNHINLPCRHNTRANHIFRHGNREPTALLSRTACSETGQICSLPTLTHCETSSLAHMDNLHIHNLQDMACRRRHMGSIQRFGRTLSTITTTAAVSMVLIPKMRA